MKSVLYKVLLLALSFAAAGAVGQDAEGFNAGPFYSHFKLTLAPGWREEAAGPLFYLQQSGDQTQWALPPFYAHTRTKDVDWTEWEALYPLVDYRRFGTEYKLQILELLSFSGGDDSPQLGVKKFTIFPFYFRQRAPDTNLNYTAVVPFYGELRNRLFKDDIKFVMFPAYSETRKKDVVTDNYLFPIFDLRHGDRLSGWQFWPLVGEEHKAPTLKINSIDQILTLGGHDKLFVLWPFFFKDRFGIGTTNEARDLTVVPFYSQLRSPLRDDTSYGWPFGYKNIYDRGQGYTEHSLFWPLWVEARGSKYVNRIFPFYSHATNASLESDFWLWPFYKVNKLHGDTLERQRARVLFILFSDTLETNRVSPEHFRRVDLWPFYHYAHEYDGNERFQMLALFEPLFPNNRSIWREYSPLWSLWRCERNPKTGAFSQNFLSSFYRYESTPRTKKLSLLFGLIQYQSGADASHWRICYVPVGKKVAPKAASKS